MVISFMAMQGRFPFNDYFKKARPSTLIPAPPLMLPNYENPGMTLNLDHYKGQVILVHFFASWCSHCRAEHPMILEAAKIPGLKIIGVSVKDMPVDLKKWLKDAGNPYSAIGLDQKAQAAQAWKVEGTPASFLIDRRGKIIYQNLGKLTAADVQDELIPLINKAVK